jgi:hypothetical protein
MHIQIRCLCHGGNRKFRARDLPSIFLRQPDEGRFAAADI